MKKLTKAGKINCVKQITKIMVVLNFIYSEKMELIL